MRRWVTWVVRRPLRVIAIIAVVTAFMAAAASRVSHEIDIRALLPPDHPYVKIHEQIESTFGGRNLIVLAVEPARGDAWQAEVLAEVKRITDEVLALPGVIPQSVVSLSSPNARSFADHAGRLDVEYLMSEVPQTPEAIAALRSKVDAIPLYRGFLVTPDASAAIVLADFWSDRTMLEIATAIETIAKRHTSEAIRVYSAGQPFVYGETSRQILEMQPRFVLSFAAISVVLYFCFGSLQGAVLPMATALLAALWTLGLMGFVGAAIDAWSNVTPILVMAMAAGHSAQILKRYFEEYARLGDSRRAVIESTSEIGVVMIAAAGTAGLGFLSLVLFHVPSLRSFAIFTAFGMLAAVTLELSFIPACRSLIAPPLTAHGNGPASRIERLIAVIGRVSGELNPVMVVGSWVALCAIVGIGILRIDTNSSFKNYLPRSSAARTNMAAVERHFEGTTPLVIEVEGANGAIGDPSVVRFVADLARELRADPTVARVSSVADLIEYANAVLGPGDGPALPNDRAVLSELLLLTYSAPYERVLDRAFSKTAIWAFLRTDETTRIDSVIARAKRFVAADPPPPGVRVLIAGGIAAASVAINEEVTSGKVGNLAAILTVVFLTGSLLFRSFVAGGLIILPLGVALVLNLGILGWAGIQLDLATSTILAMSVGSGGDFSIYLLSRIRNEMREGELVAQGLERALATAGKAIWFVALAIGIGFAILCPFGFRPLRMSGLLVPTTMFVACACSSTLLPAVVALVEPRFLSRRSSAVHTAEAWPLSA